MRKIVFYLLLLCISFSLFADGVSIKTITQNGKTVYMLQAGSFLQQKDAQLLQKKLQDLGQPILIYHPDTQSPYVLQIGPLKTYSEAKQVQKKVEPAVQGQKVALLPEKFEVSPGIVEIQKNEITDSEKITVQPTQVKITTTSTPIHEEIPPVVNKEDVVSTAIPRTEGKIWNLRNADIRAVIAEVSRITGKNFLIDPRVQGKVSIVSSTPMSDKELYQAFLSMLQVSGYAAIQNGKILKIVPNIEAKTQSPDQLSQLTPAQGDEVMVQVIPVHYVPAEQLVPVLRPLMPQWSSVSAYAPSNMLILSGRANNIRQLAKIIKQVDTSSSNGIDMVPLQHALAMDVVNTLKDLVKTQPGIGVHNQTTLAADDRNNSVLISGSQTERLRLRVLISKLDKEGPLGSNSNTQVIYLNYLRAEDLVPILAGIAQSNFSGTVGTTIGTITRPALDSTNPASNLADGSSSSGNTAAANMSGNYVTQGMNAAATPNTTGTNTQNEGSTKPTIQIIAEPNTNSIIINGPATLIRILKKVISQLDIKPAQILIEALVAEINESDFNSLGIEWGSRVGKDNTFRPGFAIINSKTGLDDFQAQIYALAQQHKANILSTPSVVVLDNRQAKILIGKQVSVASSSYPSNGNGTTTATPYTTFDRVNVALHLYVRPQITRGNGIQMQIDQGNDTLDTINATTTNPIFNISAIVTSVHVESGNIIVLGGLMQDGLTNDNTRVPILGDIPGVGRLFQHKINNRDKKILMVFIRPLILQTECDTLQVTGAKYSDVRQYELQSLRNQDYDPRNNEVIMPSLDSARLPKPFCNTAKKQIMMTK
ncbi:type II protein secretion LspD [Legionella adelaidensis]|uniref:Type II protein secretion LspD n=1 Tax=Legionella adelaidensis TaxID=45056 RepID=A0A0W0R4H6_9GAMM|nr:GspD family T2SS secretin variant LspD [Legionella adelaidensis]KTC65945.1 type II protein secretion LspD [Legionella adelaidensis]